MAINTQLHDGGYCRILLAARICHLLCTLYVPACFLNTRFYASLPRSLRYRGYVLYTRYNVRRVVLHACPGEMAMLIATCRRRQCHGISGGVRSSVVERNSRGWYCVAGRGRNPTGAGTGKVFLRLKYVDLASLDTTLTSATAARKISRSSSALINLLRISYDSRVFTLDMWWNPY